MRVTSACLLMLAAWAPCPAAEWKTLLQAGDAAADRANPRQALELYLQADRLQPHNPVVLQKIAHQYSDLADTQPTVEEKRRCATEALDYASRAVALAPRNAVNVLSLAVCHGKLAVWSDNRQKVAYSRQIKEEAERAIALDPKYAWAHDILGRWNYEVAALGRTERFFIMIFYGGLPSASCEQAIAELQRAVALEPTEPTHQMELGFALLAAGRTREARAQFARGLAMPAKARFEEEEKARVREALAALGAPEDDSRQNG